MDEFDFTAIERCINCRGCENDCPSFKIIEDYNPTLVNRDILEGNFEKWVGSAMIWQCVECHTCSEMCPQKYSWEKVMTILKGISIRRGLMPEQVSKGLNTFIKTSRLGDPKVSARKGLMLPSIPKSGLDDLKILIELLK